MDNVSILRLPQVVAKTGLSRSLIYELAARGDFPHQLRIGNSRTAGWVAREVDDWLQAQIASRQNEPRQASGAA